MEWNHVVNCERVIFHFFHFYSFLEYCVNICKTNFTYLYTTGVIFLAAYSVYDRVSFFHKKTVFCYFRSPRSITYNNTQLVPDRD